MLLGFYLKYSVGVLHGQCGICLSNNVACLNEKEFALCIKGKCLLVYANCRDFCLRCSSKITNNRTPCRENSVCTSQLEICLYPSDGYSPACYEDKCNNCELTDSTSVCVNETTYGFCYGQSKPYPDSIKSCPDGYVCRIDSNKHICVAEAEGGIASCNPVDDDTTTSENPTDPTTTQGPIIVPDTFCANQRSTGRFKPTVDTNCRDYIYCYLLAGQYLGYRYTCLDYFNAETGKCQMKKPNNC